MKPAIAGEDPLGGDSDPAIVADDSAGDDSNPAIVVGNPVGDDSNRLQQWLHSSIPFTHIQLHSSAFFNEAMFDGIVVNVSKMLCIIPIIANNVVVV